VQRSLNTAQHYRSMVRFISILLFVCGAAFGQSNMMVVYTPDTTSAVTYTDDFETASGDIDGDGSWVKVGTSDIIAVDVSGDNRVESNRSSDHGAYYLDETYGDDQYCQLVFEAGANDVYMGPAVRQSTTDGVGYYWYADGSGSSYLRRGNADWTYTNLAFGNTFVAGSTYKLSIEGYELRCYKDGELDTSIDTDGVYDDSASGDKIASGKIAIRQYGDGATQMDDFQGGE